MTRDGYRRAEEDRTMTKIAIRGTKGIARDRAIARAIAEAGRRHVADMRAMSDEHERRVRADAMRDIAIAHPQEDES